MFNPNNGRTIEKGGRAYKALIRKEFTDQDGTLVPEDPETYYEIPSQDQTPRYFINRVLYHKKNNTQVVNIDTGTRIKYTSALKKKDTKIIYVGDKDVILVPNNKFNYEKVQDTPDRPNGYWIKKGTKKHAQLKKNNELLQRMVYATSEQLIPVGGDQFKQMVQDGYEYDEKKNVMKYPVVTLVTEIKERTITKTEIDTVLATKPTSITLHIGDQTVAVGSRTRGEIRNFVNTRIFYAREDNPGLPVTLRSSSGGNIVKISIAFMGEKNCVIQSLEKHFKAKNYEYDFTALYKQYMYGVYGKDYETLSKTLHMKITINTPRDKIVYGAKRDKRSSFECA